MRRLAAIGVLALPTLLLVACGGGGAPATVTLVRDAPKRTTDAGTSRLEIVIERPPTPSTPGTQGAKGATLPPIKISGEADYHAHRGHMLIDLSQFGLPGPPIDAVFDNVTVYAPLTDFQRRRLVAAGYPGGRMAVIPNMIPGEGPPAAAPPGSYVGYVGRISPEKVAIGQTTETHAEIKSGLAGGDEVILLEAGQGRQLLDKAGIAKKPAKTVTARPATQPTTAPTTAPTTTPSTQPM